MIIDEISKIELASKFRINSEYRKLDTLRILKELLNQIGFSLEIVPFEDYKKLNELFTSLKGKQLSKCEINLIEEIVEKQNFNKSIQ